MSEAPGRQRSAIVFGARNLGRAVIEMLVVEGWAVAGVARSQATLDRVTEAGALRYRQTSLIRRACTPRLTR
jgi:Trk K+ transport system NAD-binding subunit